MESKLAEQKCVPRDGGTAPLSGDTLQQFQKQLDGGWRIVDEQRLEKQFEFPDFLQALQFTNCVGQIAEEQGHHPDIYLTYGEVRLKVWTHKIHGLTESDFILADRVNEIVSRPR